MTIEELKRYCDEEFGNINRVKEELFSIYNSEKSEYSTAERAALASFLVNIYGGIEKILKQMLIYDKLDVKESPEWHEKVLKKSGEIGILPPELFQALSRYLAFRNYFLYTYISEIRWEDIKALVDTVPDILSRLRQEVEEYIQTI
jgi:uncharacterized protein YutE (UPF0331/DUF86 family)